MYMWAAQNPEILPADFLASAEYLAEWVLQPDTETAADWYAHKPCAWPGIGDGLHVTSRSSHTTLHLSRGPHRTAKI
jgi:hypothetical protein